MTAEKNSHPFSSIRVPAQGNPYPSTDTIFFKKYRKFTYRKPIRFQRPDGFLFGHPCDLYSLYRDISQTVYSQCVSTIEEFSAFPNYL